MSDIFQDEKIKRVRFTFLDHFRFDAKKNGSFKIFNRYFYFLLNLLLHSTADY